MLPLLFMRVEMLLFDNSVLKSSLLNTQLNFQWSFCNYKYHGVTATAASSNCPDKVNIYFS